MKLLFVTMFLVYAQTPATADEKPTLDSTDPLANLQPLNNTGLKTSGIGDFQFDSPPKVELATDIPFVKAGTVYRIQWHVEPKTLANPDVVTLQYRSGRWPNVSNFTKLIDGESNQGFYDWDVPVNSATDIYIFQILTTQTSPQIRTRVSYPVKIYQPKTFLQINPAQSLSMSLGMVVALAVSMMFYLVFN